MIDKKVDRRTVAGQLGRGEGTTALVRKRTAMGVSQTVLANRTGINLATVCLIERGTSRLSLRQARLLAEALETTVDELFPVEEEIAS